jgi:acetylornithine deacetylase/succinyl-diaminopimelate desuccinylase-like protein
MTVLPRASERAALTAEQERMVAAAWAQVSEERLRDLIAAMTSIASPTGYEAPLAEHLAGVLEHAGAEAAVQALDDRQANATGRLAGAGDGPTLLLYAPIDTLTTGNAELDVPWVGPELRADMQPVGRIDGTYVRGLGASNPKGHGACVVGAIAAIASAGVPLRGDLVAGFGAGGMPANPGPREQRPHVGHGIGCAFMLEGGPRPDCAVIAKPGWTVSWEEVGLTWIEIRVHGTHTYVGSRHRLAFRNPIRDAATVVEALEAWFPEYARAHAGGSVCPQGIVAAIEGGWPHLAAVTPEMCRVIVDLRLSPRTTAAEAAAELSCVLDGVVREHPDIDLQLEQLVDIPGTFTPPDSFVIEAAVEAWEAIEGSEHVPVLDGSGATDANILRAHGVPTARVGMPKVPDLDFAMGMNTVDTREMVRLTRHLIRTAINVCTRARADVADSDAHERAAR